jgi:CheY-like chemotaxis protein
MDKKQYKVLLLGVAEHESLIFKLIFSVSAKSRASSNAYVLISTGQAEIADIVICNGSSTDKVDATSITSMAKLTLVDIAPDAAGDYLQRPLIATRVLSSLDQLMERFQQPENNAISLPGNEVTMADPVHNSTQETPEELHHIASDESGEIDEMDFSISEDEASELAIVHDESLMNPANVTDIEIVLDHHIEHTSVQSAAKTDDTDHSSASLIISSKNTETGLTPHDIISTEPAPAPSVAKINDASETRDASTSLDISSQNIETGLLANADSNEVSTNKAGNTGKALVVDDSASVRKQLELELALFDVGVDYAENADEAYQLLSKQIYDVAFLDVVLPDSDGFLICKSIKNNNKQTNVVMLTSKASPADKVKGSLAGCDDYLVKPVGRQTFQNATRKYLKLIASPKAMGA